MGLADWLPWTAEIGGLCQFRGDSCCGYRSSLGSYALTAYWVFLLDNSITLVDSQWHDWSEPAICRLKNGVDGGKRYNAYDGRAK